MTLRDDVERLATSDGRHVGSPGHRRAKEYLEARLRELGLEPYGEGFALPYAPGEGLSNLIGVAPGSAREAAPVVIGAHHDTVPGTPGADDNAAAVAIALEVGRRLVARPAGRDVLIALFDGEEPPYYLTPLMGSTAFYERQRRSEIHAALVLDLVGHAVDVPGAADLLAITGKESDPALDGVVSAAARGSALQVVSVLNRYVGDLSDHHVFRLNEVPYLFLSCGRWAHYHSPTDTPERLDYPKMERVADLTETLVRDLARVEFVGPWEGYDTTPSDLELLRGALGPVAAQLGMELDSQADIARFVAALMGNRGL